MRRTWKLPVLALLLASVMAGSAQATPIVMMPLQVQTVITTVGSPANHVVPSGDLPGVAKLIINKDIGCSGTLVGSGGFLVTAGHCVDLNGDGSPDVTTLTATFNNGQTASGQMYYLPPTWTGNYLEGSDIALVKLSGTIGFSGYGIAYSDAFDVPVDIAGYGRGGTGSTGATLPFGTLREGQNTYDVLWEVSPGYDPWYGFDFDNGNAANDAFGVGPYTLGLGSAEVDIARGDSGGPSFYNGKLIGVHSWGGTLGNPLDIDSTLNSSFGEVAADTRVPLYANWINEVAAVPEPSSLSLLCIGLVGLAGCGPRCRKQRVG